MFINSRLKLRALLLSGVFCNIAEATVIELSDVGSEVPGAIFNGISDGDNLGVSISALGDVNGDGVGDIIIGARFVDVNETNAGQCYVIFGNNSIKGSYSLSQLGDSFSGFFLNGFFADGYSCSSIGTAGDVNDDGLNDILVSATQAAPNDLNDAGQSYVVFGNSDFGAVVEMSDVGDVVPGIVLNGAATGDISGMLAKASGDINGDGINDILIGASRADPNGSNSGQGYVIFGDANSGGLIELSDIGGNTSGIVLNGGNGNDLAGFSISGIRDFNGDGVDDLIIGAPTAYSNGSQTGQSYIIFGSGSLSGVVELSSVGTTIQGITLNGVALTDLSGISVSGGGDVNKDGLSDVLVGAPGARRNNNNSTGESYLIFGSSMLSGTVNLNDVGASVSGLIVTGSFINTGSGSSVGFVGDVNGDRYDDFLIGAPSTSSSNRLGHGYLFFGASDLEGTIEVADINDSVKGVELIGADASDLTGGSVSGAGDINDDGVEDYMIGARLAEFEGEIAGRAYIIFGDDLIFEDGMEL